MMETNGFHIRNQRCRVSLELNLVKSLAETKKVIRPLAIPYRLKSQNVTAEAPVSQKRYVIEKNGFHIRNQRGRFSLNRISEQNKKIIFFYCMGNLYIGEN